MYFCARVYARETAGLCGVPRLPPSAPRTSKCCSKEEEPEEEGEEEEEQEQEEEEEEKEEKEEERGDEREQIKTKVEAWKGEERQAKESERRGKSVSGAPWKARRAERRRTRVCSVFRMHGTSAACPRPPELWSLCAHPGCSAWAAPAAYLLVSLTALFFFLALPTTFTAAILTPGTG